VVGSSARFLAGLVESCRDWDVIIPVQHWAGACKLAKPGSTVNTLGGIKCMSEESEVDFWADDLGNYFATVGSAFDLIAVHPKTQQTSWCSKR